MQDKDRNRDLSFRAQNKNAISGYLHRCVRRGPGLLGVSVDHAVVRHDSWAPVQFSEEDGIESIMRALSPAYTKKVVEGGRLIGLANKDSSTVTVGPGGQIRVSLAPCRGVDGVRERYDRFRALLDPILEQRGMAVPMLGYQPMAHAHDLEPVPRESYRLMERSFADVGPLGERMLRATCSTRVCIDCTDEDDAIRKLRVASAISPLLSLMADNSPVYEGKMRPHELIRTMLLSRSDNGRCGSVPRVFGPDYSFDSYAETILDTPAIWVPDNSEAEGGEAGGIIDAAGRTFAEMYSNRRMTPAEVTQALESVFFDVRLRGFIELRAADSMPEEFMLAYTALVKGLFYDRGALDALYALTRDITSEDVAAAKLALIEEGYGAHVYGQQAHDWVDMLLFAASNALPEDDRDALEPLKQLSVHRFTLANGFDDHTLIELAEAQARRGGATRPRRHPADKSGNKLPDVAIFPFFDAELNNLSLPAGFLGAVIDAGGLPSVLPLTEDQQLLDLILAHYDGFIIPGGVDIDPRRYGQIRDPKVRRMHQSRDVMEFSLIPKIIESGKPVLGVCRGVQSLNVALGGTLHQDIEDAFPQSKINHRTGRPYEVPVHDVDVVSGTLLESCLGESRVEVNSMHHQCVDQLGLGLMASGFAPDGVIEAIEMKDAPFVLGVQWHPEFLWRSNPAHRGLFERFVEACAAVQ